MKQLIPLQENEGRPCVISVTGNFMVYGTTEGFIRVFDLSRRYDNVKKDVGDKLLNLSRFTC